MHMVSFLCVRDGGGVGGWVAGLVQMEERNGTATGVRNGHKEVACVYTRRRD